MLLKSNNGWEILKGAGYFASEIFKVTKNVSYSAVLKKCEKRWFFAVWFAKVFLLLRLGLKNGNEKREAAFAQNVKVKAPRIMD